MSESTPAKSDSNELNSPAEADQGPESPDGPVRTGSIKSTDHKPRSCVTCRRRKVRCDKKHPSCSNCTKAGIECVFPGPGRAKRKTRKPQDAELLARLKKLEGVIQSLGAQVDDSKGPGVRSNTFDELNTHNAQNSPRIGFADPKRKSSSPVDKQMGRLVVNDGRSRYVSNAFWASMGDEVAEMQDILDAPSSDEEEDVQSPQQSHTGSSASSHQGFILGYSSLMQNLRSLHPSPTQVFVLWMIFEENIDPVVRILHRPTAKNLLIKASGSPDNLSKQEEAVLFSIYYGSVCSLTPSQCRQQLGEDKETMANRFRFAVEQALSRANFLNTSSLMVLQAFVLFLICVRSQDDTRMVWSLSGLAVHIAQALGIHRDGTSFGLSPFETEMRRRLWWHICVLDTRSAEDHGADPSFTEAFYDARLPLNINDEDICPATKETPQERQGSTEMTFSLIRFELSAASRKMNFQAPGKFVAGLDERQKTLAERERTIEEIHKRIEERYLQHCNMSIPIYWVAATVGRLVLAKMWLLAHHPLQQMATDTAGAPERDIRDRLFITSVEVIEFANLLEKNENTAKWGWLFRTYMQWHAVAFVLSELCYRPPGPQYERAWQAVESVYDDRVMGRGTRDQKGMLWKPMRQLMAKAQAIRKKHQRDGQAGRNDILRANTTSTASNSPWTPEPLRSIESMAHNNLTSGGSIKADFEAFGLPYDYSSPLEQQVKSMENGVQQPLPDSNPVLENLTTNDISNWMTDDPMAMNQLVLPNPNILDWSNWNMGTLNIGDTMSMEPMEPQADQAMDWFSAV